MSDIDLEKLREWVGRTDIRHDVITPAPVRGLSATLDYDGPLVEAGEPLPPCWHWLYFLDAAPTSDLGEDGHPRRGGFLPPISLPRRMWAGSRLKFLSSLKVGDQARRETTITDIKQKRGRSGDLVFLNLQHLIYVENVLAIDEEQDLVYRSAPGTGEPARTTAAPADPQWSRTVTPDSTLLFRYSALTFNSHRIHYDREYAMGEEGYPSLVVQGPLTVTLLLDLLQREMPAAKVAGFEFRASSPLVEGLPLTLHGRRDDTIATLWASDSSRGLALQATARFEPGT